MRTTLILVGFAFLAAVMASTDRPFVTCSLASMGLLVGAASSLVTRSRWRRPILQMKGSGVVSLRKLKRTRLRFACVAGQMIEVPPVLTSPVLGRPALAWRLAVYRRRRMVGRRLDWAGHDGERVRLTDGTAVVSVLLPRWAAWVGEEEPQRFTQVGAAAEHGLRAFFAGRASFAGRAERWLSRPQFSFVETSLSAGAELLVFGKVYFHGDQVQIEPRVLAVDGKVESLVGELEARARRAAIVASALLLLLAAMLLLANSMGWVVLDVHFLLRLKEECQAFESQTFESQTFGSQTFGSQLFGRGAS